MEAPEKIYLQACGDCNDNDCENCKFEDLEDNVTWCKDKIFDKDIEYTRTDAFIEKAVEYIITHIPDLHTLGISAKMDDCIIKEFRKYMKGE